MKLNNVFGGDYLKAEDLQGKSVPVVIEAIDVKDFDDGKKLIIRFEGKDKTLVCNRTNASILENNFGSSDTDDWIGKKATLLTKKVEFQGKLVPAIRFALVESPKSQPETDPEDDGSGIPF